MNSLQRSILWSIVVVICFVGAGRFLTAQAATSATNVCGALGAQTTGDCTFGPCTGCDVCSDLGVNIELGGGRRGIG